VLIANDGAPNRLYRNNGAGVFADSSSDLPQDAGRTISFAAADFDSDGDVDLLECSFRGPVPTRALANDGLGHFTVVPGGLPVVHDYAHRFAPGDLDGDGDLDAFLVTQGPPHVYWNQRRQLTWRELPRIGRTLTMDLRGGHNDLFVFAASAARVNVPLPGLGTLQVDLRRPDDRVRPARRLRSRQPQLPRAAVPGAERRAVLLAGAERHAGAGRQPRAHGAARELTRRAQPRGHFLANERPRARAVLTLHVAAPKRNRPALFTAGRQVQPSGRKWLPTPCVKADFGASSPREPPVRQSHRPGAAAPAERTRLPCPA
jgi:hypothetical protein